MAFVKSCFVSKAARRSIWSIKFLKHIKACLSLLSYWKGALKALPPNAAKFGRRVRDFTHQPRAQHTAHQNEHLNTPNPLAVQQTHVSPD